MFSLSSLSALIWIVLLNVFGNVSVEFFGLSRLYINCMMVYLLFLPAVDLFQTRERYFFKYKNTVAISVLTVVGTSLVSVLLVLLLKNRLNGIVFGYVFPTVLIGIVVSLHFIHVGKRVNTNYWGYALKFCLPFIPHLLSLTLLNSMDRVMITKICGAEDTALYSLAYSCGHIVSILLTSLNSAYAPWLGEKLVSNEHKEVYNFSKTYVTTFMILAAGIMLIAPEILLVLGGKMYMDAIYVMPPVAMGCVCQFVYTMYVNVEQFNKKTIGMAVGSISAALINYVLNAICIPIYGYYAAAYTTLVGFVWLVAVHIYLVHKMGYRDLYNEKFILAALAMMIFVTVFINYLYKLTTVRYVFVVAYGALLLVGIYKYKNQILSFLKGK